MKLTAEQIMLKHIPNGIQNIKGKGDGKPQYQAEKDIIIKCMLIKQVILTYRN